MHKKYFDCIQKMQCNSTYIHKFINIISWLDYWNDFAIVKKYCHSHEVFTFFVALKAWCEHIIQCRNLSSNFWVWVSSVWSFSSLSLHSYFKHCNHDSNLSKNSITMNRSIISNSLDPIWFIGKDNVTLVKYDLFILGTFEK